MHFNDHIVPVREYLSEQNLDAALLLKPANQQYISGFKAIIYSRPILTLICKDKSIMIVPGLEEAHARSDAEIDEIYVYYEHPDAPNKEISPWGVFEKLVRETPLKRIGIESGGAPHGVAQMLEKWGAAVYDLDPFIIDLRVVKDDNELNMLRQAGKLVSYAVAKTLSGLGSGRNEMEVEAIGDVAVLQKAAEDYPGSAVEPMSMTTSGVQRTAFPHIISSVRTFGDRELIIHSRQIGLNGYRAECERTCFIGQPTDRQREVFQVMAESQRAAIDAIKEGVLCKEIDDAARSVIRKAGLEEYAIHRTGHGLGLEPHEAPYLRYDDETPLKAGMVVSIEPGIYIPDVGGFRHSDTVIVTAEGGEEITFGPVELDEVIF